MLITPLQIYINTHTYAHTNAQKHTSHKCMCLSLHYMVLSQPSQHGPISAFTTWSYLSHHYILASHSLHYMSLYKRSLNYFFTLNGIQAHLSALIEHVEIGPPPKNFEMDLLSKSNELDNLCPLECATH